MSATPKIAQRKQRRTIAVLPVMVRCPRAVHDPSCLISAPQESSVKTTASAIFLPRQENDRGRRKRTGQRPVLRFQRRQPAGAVAERIDGGADAVEYRQEQVRHRLLGTILDVPARLD